MFGIILPSRPVLGPPVMQTISPNQFAYTFPAAPVFSHIVVFLLPENTLPADVLAGIYIQFPPTDNSIPSDFRLLGALSAGKQSAIFRVNTPRATSANRQEMGEVGGIAEIDMDAEDSGTGNTVAGGNITVGISVEPINTLQPQLDALTQTNAASGRASALAGATGGTSVPTKVLAQRIIQNAFNFLSSFAGGDEKVSLKSFENWWKKFESRIESDPGFLERDTN